MLIPIRYMFSVICMPAVVFFGLLPEVKTALEFIELLRVTGISVLWTPRLLAIPLLSPEQQRAIGDAYGNALEKT